MSQIVYFTQKVGSLWQVIMSPHALVIRAQKV